MAGNGHTSFYAMFRLGGSTHTLSAKFSKGVVPMAKNRLFPVPGIYGLHMTAPHGETIEMNWICVIWYRSRLEYGLSCVQTS